MERLNFRRHLTPALALSLAVLTFASCGGEETPEPSAALDEGPHIEAEYYSNGTRMLRYIDDGEQFADILQTCDGLDLVEQTEFYKFGYGAAGNAMERTLAHPACADGLLTPEDFPTPAR